MPADNPHLADVITGGYFILSVLTGFKPTIFPLSSPDKKASAAPMSENCHAAAIMHLFQVPVCSRADKYGGGYDGQGKDGITKENRNHKKGGIMRLSSPLLRIMADNNQSSALMAFS